MEKRLKYLVILFGSVFFVACKTLKQYFILLLNNLELRMIVIVRYRIQNISNINLNARVKLAYPVEGEKGKKEFKLQFQNIV